MKTWLLRFVREIDACHVASVSTAAVVIAVVILHAAVLILNADPVVDGLDRLALRWR